MCEVRQNQFDLRVEDDESLLYQRKFEKCS